MNIKKTDDVNRRPSFIKQRKNSRQHPFPDNAAHYLDNLFGLGLIDIDYTKTISPSDVYEKIDALSRDNNPSYFSELFDNNLHEKIDYDKGVVSITQFGLSFIGTCMKTFSSSLNTPMLPGEIYE